MKNENNHPRPLNKLDISEPLHGETTPFPVYPVIYTTLVIMLQKLKLSSRPQLCKAHPIVT